MSNSNINTKKLYSSNTAQIGDALIKLDYHMILTEDNVYSLLVVMADECNNQNVIDTTFAYDITRCEQKACEILKILNDNSVTPCSVKYILEDCL